MGNDHKPDPQAFFDNMKGPMPIRKKLFLFLKNNARKMATAKRCCGHPPLSFRIEIKKIGLLTYGLFTVQTLPVERATAFTFFEDPRNLFGITPSWLDFRIKDPERAKVFENAQFDYTIRWLGFRMRWRSRITEYVPPERFTDVQVIGPYRSWTHRHSLSATAQGTLMEDEVLYRLPFYAAFLQPLILRQLRDIFIYRAVKIEEWVLDRQGWPGRK